MQIATTRLNSSPKDLPYLEEGAVLTTPIDISVAVPVEEVKFYQSKEFFDEIIFVIIFLATFIVSVYFATSFKDFYAWLSFLFTCLTLYKVYKRFKANGNLNDSHRFVDDQFTWQTKTIIVINDKDVEFSDYFDNSIKHIDYEVIDEFYGSSDSFDVGFKPIYLFDNNPKYQYLMKSNVNKNAQWSIANFELKHRFILVNGKYRIEMKDLVRLMNQLKDNENGKVVYRKSYL